MAASDVELLESWRNGDRSAANELFERYFERLFRFFATKLDSGVEDLVQETLLGCVQSRDRLRDDAAFRTFLFSVARRRLYRKWRDEGRGANAIDFGLMSVTDLAPSPSSIVGDREQRHQLVGALRRIPVELQIALELFYWEEMRSADIATVLGIPEGTVRSRLRRARQRLKEEMGAAAGAANADADEALTQSFFAAPGARPDAPESSQT